LLNNNLISQDKIEKAKKILQILKEIGYEAFIVGGAVRDSILDISFDDIDIITNANLEIIKKLFSYIPIGIKYGSIKIFFEKYVFELTLYRTEGPYLNYRNPSYVNFISDVKQDVLRRDFTINGLLMNEKGQLFDYIDGMKDLKKKQIKTIGEPYTKLTEDALRMIRIFYLQSKLNFEIEYNTQKALKENIFLLTKIKKDRIITELKKIFSQKYLQKTLISLKETNAYSFLKLFSREFPLFF
jgi:poly(A) polymerase/tRNA nucleotidyltransferase (CCA-adding enzyme)